MSRTARTVHLVTGLVAAAALVLQFVLVWQGHAVLDEQNAPGRATRVGRYFCYFTILSNLLVCVVSLRDARTSDDARLWRVLRLNAVVGIVVTGVVHFFLLRPLLDLDGPDRLADHLLHLAVPTLAVLGWLVVGPRGRVAREDLLPSAIFPALYMVWTLAHGAWSGWYPYPFIDVGERGYPQVLLSALGVVALIATLSVAALALDRRLPSAAATTPGPDRG